MTIHGMINDCTQLDAYMNRACGRFGTYDVQTVRTSLPGQPGTGMIVCRIDDANYPGSRDQAFIEVAETVTIRDAMLLLDDQAATASLK